jgi:DNA-binding PadR family transcriptional regulator
MKTSKLDNVVSDFSRFYILTILYEGPTHGYEIMTKFKERVGKKISPGLIYPFLNLLDERKLVSIEREMVGEKERKVYYLTEEGLEFTERSFQRFAGIISSALESSLDVCAHCGCKVYEGAHSEIIEGKEVTFCCIHCAGHYKHELQE